MNVRELASEQKNILKDAIILVVDDNMDNREILCRWLARKGVATLSATSGQEAIEIVEKTRVDLIFLDLMMPNMSGFDVLERLRSTYEAWKLPIIVATARVDKDSILEAFDKGANDYITKPIIFPVAISRARNLLNQKFLQEEIREINSHQEIIIQERTTELQETIEHLEIEVLNSLRTQHDLRRLKEEAEIANKAKSEFLANMSHELRTPLNAVIGFSDIMKSDILDMQPLAIFKEYSTDINNSALHLLGIINDILDISNISEENITLDEENVSLLEIFKPAVDTLSLLLKRKRLTLEIDFERFDRIILKVDRRRLRQIIINLLSNAIKFTTQGGHIEITATVCDVEGFSLSFKDDGIGILPENIQKALAPFSQIDSGLNRSYEGVGLGLTLVKALAELHGGLFVLTGELGEGATATLYLPPKRIISRKIFVKQGGE